MDSRWKRKALSRWSSVHCVMRLPSSHEKSIPSLLMAPIVSAAIGTNNDWLSEEYLFLFLSAAASAAAPGVWDVSWTYDWASVSLTVSDVPRGALSLFPRQQCDTVRSLPISSKQAWRLLQRREVRLRHRSPLQVVQAVMPLWANVAPSARQTM